MKVSLKESSSASVNFTEYFCPGANWAEQVLQAKQSLHAEFWKKEILSIFFFLETTSAPPVSWALVELQDPSCHYTSNKAFPMRVSTCPPFSLILGLKWLPVWVSSGLHLAQDTRISRPGHGQVMGEYCDSSNYQDCKSHWTTRRFMTALDSRL